MISIRKSEERGRGEHGWLDSRHSFSFADYYDPAHQGFRKLRVINEDWVAPRGGFPNHPHRDMEILTYVLEGSLAHKDSMGNSSIIRPGEVQRMSAGTGVVHSEFNASERDAVRLLQIWIHPERAGLTPSYEQREFPLESRRGVLRVLAAPDGSGEAVRIHQDVTLYGTLLSPGQSVQHALASGRHAWVQLTSGAVRVNGTELRAGDGAAISNESALTIECVEDAELLLFDLN